MMSNLPKPVNSAHISMPSLCQSQACAIQDCLAKNDYQDDRCRDVINKMMECCEQVHYKSYICDGFNPKLSKKNKVYIEIYLTPGSGINLVCSGGHEIESRG